MTEAPSKLVGCRLEKSEYEFGIIHRADTKHQAADALSCLKVRGEDRTPLEHVVLTLIMFLKSLAVTINGLDRYKDR